VESKPIPQRVSEIGIGRFLNFNRTKNHKPQTMGLGRCAIQGLLMLSCITSSWNFSLRHRLPRFHNPLKKKLENTQTLDQYWTLKQIGGLEVDKFATDLYNGLKGDSRSVAVSTFVDLMHREQVFNNTGILDVKKAIKSNHIRAIESPEVLSRLMDMSEAFVDPQLALNANVTVHAAAVDQAGLVIELPTAHKKAGSHWLGRSLASVRNKFRRK
jgi:hypothetical protein